MVAWQKAPPRGIASLQRIAGELATAEKNDFTDRGVGLENMPKPIVYFGESPDAGRHSNRRFRIGERPITAV
jgi:hypothetical protein